MGYPMVIQWLSIIDRLSNGDQNGYPLVIYGYLWVFPAYDYSLSNGDPFYGLYYWNP